MLRPYTKWEEFSGDALNYWGIYKKEIQPIGISRLGLRYIYRIEIPKENLDFDDYFINVPRIPEGLPQMFNGLFLKMQVLCNMDGGIIANITETFETPTKGKIHFILDIDVVKIDMKDQNDKMLGGYFDELRKFKNFIFESLITDKTRSLFN